MAPGRGEYAASMRRPRRNGLRSGRCATKDSSSSRPASCIFFTKLPAAGLDFLVLDQTRPDIQAPVARVIVPGLRHFHPRFASGRLYDVPVKLGLRKRPLREAELNPLHPRI
jgi:YcaO cyclodehydratase, ATP-ad Mg2+-binding